MIAIAPTKLSLSGDLDNMLRLVQRGGRTVVAGNMNTACDTGSGLRITHPLARSGQAIGGIAVELKRGNPEHQKTITKPLKWGNARLELLLNQMRQKDPSGSSSSRSD